MKLLVVEDNKKMASYLKQGLNESGYMVDLFHNGIDGLDSALTQYYDLIILDIMLPKLDGLSILNIIRRSGQELPILLLSARDQVSDRVKGLNQGADDYLIKPFDFSELLARIRTLLRRNSPVSNQVDTISVSNLVLDTKRCYVMRDNIRIDLTAKEFSLLRFLMLHKDEVLSRTLIASQVWDMNFDSDTNVIDVAMRRLRSKIDDNYTHKLIHTVRGMGYVIKDKP